MYQLYCGNDNLDNVNYFDILSIFRDVDKRVASLTPAGKNQDRFQAQNGKGLALFGQRQLWLPMGPRRTSGEWQSIRAAAVVRRIFLECRRGRVSQHSKGTPRREKTYPVRAQRISAPVRAVKYTDPCAWSTTTTVSYPQTPGGHRAQGFRKNRLENHKTKSTRKTAPENSDIFDGETPPLWTRKHGNTVQRLMGQNAAPPSGRIPRTALTGFLLCRLQREADPPQQPLCKGQVSDDAFVCSSYRQFTPSDCKLRTISHREMEAVIL